jgi:hypothetical protein
MRIQFIKDITIEEEYDTCCFSGISSTRKHEFKTNDIITINEIERGEKQKPVRLNTFIIYNDTLHSDRMINIPEDSYIIKEE